MAIVFNKLFELMKIKGLTTYKIRQQKIIGQATLQSLRNNEPVSTETVAIMCKALDCQPGDIMEFIDEK